MTATSGSQQSYDEEKPPETPSQVMPEPVDWNEPGDPENPQNWPSWKRYSYVALVSVLTLIMNLSSTIFAPGSAMLKEEFGIRSTTVGTLTVSIYMLGLVGGPVVAAPASEMFGRLPVYHVCNALFLAFTIACAKSTNTSMFLAFRLLAGAAGSAPLTIGGGTIAGVMPKEQRGLAMGMFSLGPTLGPSVGPIAGGFIAETVGWRWTFWVLAIAHGVVAFVAVVFMRETFAKILLQRKSTRIGAHATANVQDGARSSSAKQLLLASSIRPLLMLAMSPTVSLLSLAVAFAFGLTFLLITTFSSVFQDQYGFSLGISGLCYLGMGTGMLLAVAIFSSTSGKVLRWHIAKGLVEPENRLALMAVFYPVMPIGFFWYGWAADAEKHWIVPLIGAAFVGFGSLFILMPAQLYLVDAFGPAQAASALAAVTMLRSVFAAFLPLAGPPLYEKLGLGWGNSLLGFLAVAFVPIPLLFYRYGTILRHRYPLKF
ncbi:MFS multidrug transporter [Macrophomina phaseolina]|uniref:MFS multidrug transporter n=1 Tax=Macrophomina phaseolina TaxID=35725 RepID=A0ABQ8G0E5_9PEZI|nr:MFS multidrug transporter [Macrophomina phaseolina]